MAEYQVFVGKEPEWFPESPTAWLVPDDSWNDYGLKCRYMLYVQLLPLTTQPIAVGSVKIISPELPVTEESAHFLEVFELVPPKFKQLDSSRFCSLGQSSNYYSNLHSLEAERGFPADFVPWLLSTLNDITVSKADPWWETNHWYEFSLVRTNAAHLALTRGASLLQGEVDDKDMVNRIPLLAATRYGEQTIHPKGAALRFNGNSEVPGRMNVLVGRNGAGKTTLLESLALWLSTASSSGKFDHVPDFASVVFVSHNAFDAFNILGEHRDITKNLQFVGVRPIDRQKLSELHNYFATVEVASYDSLKLVLGEPSNLVSVLPGYANDLVSDLQDLVQTPGWADFVSKAFDQDGIAQMMQSNPEQAFQKMSAGQRALATIYAGLYKRLDRRSLVLIDEPENFIHPSLLARFTRVLNDLLHNRHAFAVVATHSPIVVQETPSNFAWIAERGTDEESDITSLRNPDLETFGESVDVINEILFDTNPHSSHWKAILTKLVERGLSNQEIQDKVGSKQLPLLARTFIERVRIAGKRA